LVQLGTAVSVFPGRDEPEMETVQEGTARVVKFSTVLLENPA